MRLNRIYVLVDPRTALVRYVGICQSAMRERFCVHLYDARRGSSTHCARWIRTLLDTGREPIVLLIEKTRDRDREAFWIAHYRRAGCPLTNLTAGGGGTPGCPATPERRQRVSEALKGRRHSDERCQRNREAHTGRKASLEHRQHIAQAHRGQHTGSKNNAAKLTEAQIAEIRTRYAAGGVFQRELASEFGVHRSNISMIVNRRRWNNDCNG